MMGNLRTPRRYVHLASSPRHDGRAGCCRCYVQSDGRAGVEPGSLLAQRSVSRLATGPGRKKEPRLALADPPVIIEMRIDPRESASRRRDRAHHIPLAIGALWSAAGFTLCDSVPVPLCFAPLLWLHRTMLPSAMGQ